jgi:uncharacterized protein DUF4136
MRRLAMAVMVVLAGAAANAQDVSVDFDKNADFSALKTFTVKIGTSWNNPISEQRMIEQFTKALTAKGWQRSDSNPDAAVVLHGATEMKKSLNTFYSGGYGGYGWGGWGGGGGSATTTTSEYTVGTLVVDIFSERTKKLVFRGTASDEISSKPEKNAKKVTKVTNKMFKNFPPGAEKEKQSASSRSRKIAGLPASELLDAQRAPRPLPDPDRVGGEGGQDGRGGAAERGPHHL